MQREKLVSECLFWLVLGWRGDWRETRLQVSSTELTDFMGRSSKQEKTCSYSSMLGRSVGHGNIFLGRFGGMRQAIDRRIA